MKMLNAQEKKAIEGIKDGKTKRGAIMQAYNCKNVQVADVIGQRVFKRQRVLEELQLLREQERKQLLPKALKRMDEILDAKPDKPPSWDIIQKVAQGVVTRSYENEEEKSELQLFLGGIINVSKLKDLMKTGNEIKEAEVIEEVKEDRSIKAENREEEGRVKEG